MIIMVNCGMVLLANPVCSQAGFAVASDTWEVSSCLGLSVLTEFPLESVGQKVKAGDAGQGEGLGPFLLINQACMHPQGVCDLSSRQGFGFGCVLNSLLIRCSRNVLKGALKSCVMSSS